MPRLIPTSATVRRVVALGTLALSIVSSWPPYDYAFLGTLIAIPIVWCLLWVASLALQDLTGPRIPNPAVSPFESEERLARIATLCATVPPLLPSLPMLVEGHWPWTWAVLALVTAWWFPSA
ncbi:MAG: hypothetical protein JKY37_25415, partial [Nannocystaceae bacterium]|nr:hypothetical protein [Nannocystaceae bacterium]